MKAITQEEYLKLRESTIEDYKRYHPDSYKVIVLTCDDCPARFECEFAADLYNTDGDCLAEK